MGVCGGRAAAMGARGAARRDRSRRGRPAARPPAPPRRPALPCPARPGCRARCGVRSRRPFLAAAGPRHQNPDWIPAVRGAALPGAAGGFPCGAPQPPAAHLLRPGPAPAPPAVGGSGSPRCVGRGWGGSGLGSGDRSAPLPERVCNAGTEPWDAKETLKKCFRTESFAILQ